MFNLNDGMRYLLYNRPTDMRKSFHTLGGIVRNAMGCDPTNGDVYIFMNKQRNRIKLLHWERGGMVLYSKLLEQGTFPTPQNADGTDQVRMEWRELVLLVEGIVERSECRHARLEKLKGMREK